VGEGECEVGFAIEKAEFTIYIKDRGKKFSSDALRLSSRRSSVEKLRRVH
jgi:hypothetical protein